MTETAWSQIVEKMEMEGISVERECIANTKTAGLWCIKASRNGCQWAAYAGDPTAALEGVKSQAREILAAGSATSTPAKHWGLA